MVPVVLALAVVCAVLQVGVSTGAAALVHRAVAVHDGPSGEPWPGSRPSVSEDPLPRLPVPVDPAEPSAPSSPAGYYAAPRPDRPVVELRMDVADDLAAAVGSESVLFTPDLPVCELVLRLWPNKPETAEAGNEMVLTQVTVDGVPLPAVVESAGGLEGRTGTLARVALPACVGPGTAVDVDVAWTLTLGRDTPERVGYDPGQQLAWMATAFPVLAWEHGVGWMTDPAVPLFGEMAGSEVFELRQLDVVAPSGLDVMGTGRLTAVTEATGRPGAQVHSFTADAVRDVAVVVGDLDVVEQVVDGVSVHVATAAQGDPAQSTQQWTDDQVASMRLVADYLGPYPYTDLWVTVVDDFPTGVEFPGAIFYTDTTTQDFPGLVEHETAHMWLYGLVGNDQGRDPWIDEGMTSFVEAQVTGRGEEVAAEPVGRAVEGYLGASMAHWAAGDLGDLRYGDAVYGQGATAMAQARAAAGGEAFDAALREYVRANAHTIATPSDVEAAFAALPAAVEVLRDAGAFSGDAGDP